MDEPAKSPVSAKKEWLQNAFKKKERPPSPLESFQHAPRSHTLIQDRHRWIEQEFQLRESLKLQGKSELAISQELVGTRKKWLEDEQVSPGISPSDRNRNASGDFREANPHSTSPCPSSNKAQVACHEVVDARRKWLEETFGAKRRSLEGNGPHNVVSDYKYSMDTNIGLKVERHDEAAANALEAMAQNSKQGADKEQSAVPEDSKEAASNTDWEGPNLACVLPTIVEGGISYMDIIKQVSSESASSTYGTDDESAEPVGAAEADTQADKPYPDLSRAPSDERLGLSSDRKSKDIRWKPPHDDDFALDTPCLEACIIL